MERRDEVIDYVSKNMRKVDRQIITFGTMSAKLIVRDVGRVLNYPYTTLFISIMTKLIPNELGITIKCITR